MKSIHGPPSKQSIDGTGPEKGGKSVGQMVANKNQAAENHQNALNTQKARQEGQNTKGEKQSEKLEGPKAVALRQEENREKAEEKEPAHDESQAENDIFLSESVGIDVSVDSTALKQFDYNESVDEDE